MSKKINVYVLFCVFIFFSFKSSLFAVEFPVKEIKTISVKNINGKIVVTNQIAQSSVISVSYTKKDFDEKKCEVVVENTRKLLNVNVFQKPQSSTSILKLFSSKVNCEADITISIPSDAEDKILELENVSGDIQVTGAVVAESIDTSNVSGDISINGAYKVAKLENTSGDILLDLSVLDLKIKTVSGDTSVKLNKENLMKSFNFNGVSGNLNFTSIGEMNTLEVFSVKTVSGDTKLSLNKNQKAKIVFDTISGKSELKNANRTEQTKLTLKVNSVSGDLYSM